MTAGTVLHRAKLPLTTRFWAAYLMASHSNGISALQLQKLLGLGSYKSAWLLAQAAPGDGRPSPPAAFRPGRGRRDQPAPMHQGRPGRRWRRSRPPRQATIVGAIEVEDGKPGRLRLAAIADYSAKSLHAFIASAVVEGGTLKSDAWSSYPGVAGMRHRPHTIGPMAAHLVLPWVHRVFADLKRWPLGIYHGLRARHLQAYLDEFVFRFNRRHDRPAAFHRLLGSPPPSSPPPTTC